jgi:DNA-binding HxlR family transcriptional regulator
MLAKCKRKDLWIASEIRGRFWRMAKQSSGRVGKRLKNQAGEPLRSPCPLACLLDVCGDRWTLLVIRDLFFGRSRFKDFCASPEGIPTNILSDRLNRLLRHGLVEQVPAADGTQRMAYQLTPKGLALGPVLEAMRDWGLKWEPSTRVEMQG